MAPVRVLELARQAPDDSNLRVILAGEDMTSGKQVSTTVELPLGDRQGDGAERLAQHAGLAFRIEADTAFVDHVVFGGQAEKQKIDFDWELVSLQVPAKRPPKELFYLPALLLFGIVYGLQRRRRDIETKHAAIVAAE